MKCIFTFLLSGAVALNAWAQIPNAGFESWTGAEPEGWITNNLQQAGAVTKSTNAHGGSGAVQLNVVATGSGIYNVLPGKITIGDSLNNFAGFSDTLMPITLEGWYILDPKQGDFLTINSTVTDKGLVVGRGIIPQIGDTTSVYKMFELQYDHGINTSCDTVSISIQIANTNSTPTHVGTTAIIDDLRFSHTLGIEEVRNVAALEPCSPNPATNVANIIYSIVGYSTVTLELYDLAGQKVQTLLNSTKQSEGRYKIPTDVSNLANGMYFYRLNVDGQTLTQKLVVAK